MTTDEFELFLDEVCRTLGDEVRESKDYHEAAAFQSRVLKVMQNVAHKNTLQILPCNHPHAFPDIKANGFGVEVKSTRQDSWDATANSILETMRDEDAEQVYVVFGKMGGMPGVLWRRYEAAICHVRISHAPRFVLGMHTEEGKSLFDTIGVSYEDFAKKTPEEKMSEVRKYARARLRPGESRWWLERQHSLELTIRRYHTLERAEKLKMRAEVAVLFPEIVAPRHTKDKYTAALGYLLTRHGVIGGRDMYSAGSVKGLPQGLDEVRDEMETAFREFSHEILQEHWPEGTPIPADAEGRKMQWLKLADVRAKNKWRPSKYLFQPRR